MNITDIIRKISKKAGVPDTESKKFFEIFLKHASDILKPGESLKIPGIGLFQLRVGQIENSSGRSEQSFIYSDLIVFIQEGEQNLREGEEIIINVPSGFDEEYQPIDSFFSLSIGKPVIPLKGVKSSEFFIPPSGSELRGLMESKISRLLEEAEKIEGGKETESILLKSKGKSIEGEPDKKDEKVPDRSDFLKTREFENLSWDFGENLSQEIEEESILDFDKPELAEEEIIQEDWIGDSEKVSPKESGIEPVFEEEKFDENPDEEIFEDIIDEEIVQFDSEDELTDEEISEPDLKAEINGSLELKNEQNVLPQDENSENYLIDKEEEKEEESGIAEPFSKNFQRVTSLTKEFNTSVNDEREEEGESDKLHPKITEVRGGFQKVRRTTAEFNFDLSGIKEFDDDEQLGKKGKSAPAANSYKGYRKQSIVPSLIIAFVVVIALGLIIFLYLKLKNDNHMLDGTNKIGTSKQQTKIIDRNYDVPVTYPYDSTGGKKPENKVNNENHKSNINTKSEAAELREPVNAERIENYIYKYPSGLVVQVSSWKSKTVALGEVQKYRKAGYDAFAETSNIPGMGLYYRVRVGYFNSLNEAKEFSNEIQ